MSGPLARDLSRGQVSAAGLALAATVAPHALHLSASVMGFFFAVVAARLLASRTGRVLQARLTLLGLSFAGVLVVTASHPRLFTRDGGVALLSVMLGLKIVEMKTRRDLVILAFLGYFGVVTQFLYARGMGLTAYLAAVVLALTALLVNAARGRAAARPVDDLRVAGTLLGQALPVMAVLFVLFPRLDGPLWTLGAEEKTGITGLSGQLSPGSVSRLARSDAVAFRVTFEGDPPPAGQRYFRGPVLSRTDGRTWSAASQRSPSLKPAPAEGRRVAQRVTMEANGEPWLLALDSPVRAPQDAVLTADSQLLVRRPLRERTTYRVESVPGAPRQRGLSDAEQAQALQVPPRVSERMKRLAARLRQGGAAPAAVVARALEYFNTQPFVYTLNPGSLGKDPLDAFLFETRRGFCEHYAAAFTLLMRLAGIPARVVTGYQGGELNPRGDYLMVRQADAHAWSEVWLGGAGWTRVDPTAAVAPERTERSIDPEVSALEGAVRFDASQRGLLGRVARQLSWGLDALDLGWHRWILGYTRDRQGRLLESLGMGFLEGQALGLGAVVAAMAVLGTLALGLARTGGRPRPDPVQASYLRFCRRLARRGLARAPEEGPWDFSRRVVAARPDLGPAVRAITALYIGLRYARDSSRADLRRLRRLVRGLRV